MNIVLLGLVSSAHRGELPCSPPFFPGMSLLLRIMCAPRQSGRWDGGSPNIVLFHYLLFIYCIILCTNFILLLCICVVFIQLIIYY